MEKPHPGPTASMINVQSVPGKYASSPLHISNYMNLSSFHVKMSLQDITHVSNKEMNLLAHSNYELNDVEFNSDSSLHSDVENGQ